MVSRSQFHCHLSLRGLLVNRDLRVMRHGSDTKDISAGG